VGVAILFFICLNNILIVVYFKYEFETQERKLEYLQNVNYKSYLLKLKKAKLDMVNKSIVFSERISSLDRPALPVIVVVHKSRSAHSQHNQHAINQHHHHYHQQQQQQPNHKQFHHN
jgi:hypothetical protein